MSKVAVVTGASKGIGRAIAETLAREGYSLALVGRDKTALDEVATGMTVPVATFAFDLSQVEKIPELVEEIRQALGEIAVLVNNAGICIEKPFGELSRDEFRDTMVINFDAVVELTRSVLPSLEKARENRQETAIITIGSIAGQRGYRRGTAYCASKFALEGFMQALFEDVRSQGIRVSLVDPGPVNTDMHKGDERYESALLIQPDDVAEAVRYVLNSPTTVCPVNITLLPQYNPRR